MQPKIPSSSQDQFQTMIATHQNGFAPTAEKQQQYISYKQRWGVLLTVVTLNISCGAIWINNFPVATTVAAYYGRETKDVNWFSSLFFLGSFPFTFGASFVSHKYGLRVLLHLSSILNLTSAVIRAVATSGLFEDKDTQFFVGIFGQCFAAAANSAFLGIAPKVSQKWFPDSQKGICTTIGVMARPLGVILTQLTVPAIVKEKDDVPLNNYIWLVPCAISQIITIIFMTREDPKTPPSKSALHIKKPSDEKVSVLRQVRKSFASLGFFLLFLSIGGGIGITFTFGTLMQQMLCPLGYSETFAGLTNGLLLFGGFVGTAFTTTCMRKTSRHIELLKILLAFSLLSLIGFLEVILINDQKALIIILAIAFGIFGIGTLPVGLELAVECTYPIDETIPGVFIYMSGQLQAFLFILLIPITAKETYDYDSSTCGVSQPYDYTVPVMIVGAIIVIFGTLSMAFFHSDYNRRNIVHDHDPKIPSDHPEPNYKELNISM